MSLELFLLELILLAAGIIIAFNRDSSIFTILALIASIGVTTGLALLTNVGIFIIAALPIGFLLAWLAYDELVPGRKWFYALSIISLVGSIILYAMHEKTVSVMLILIALVTSVSIVKSYDTRLTRKRKI